MLPDTSNPCRRYAEGARPRVASEVAPAASAPPPLSFSPPAPASAANTRIRAPFIAPTSTFVVQPMYRPISTRPSSRRAPMWHGHSVHTTAR